MSGRSPTPGASASGYMMQLDGLRAVAVGLVFLSHFPLGIGITGNLHWGHVGVQLFFVLSGFLITGILVRCKDRIASGDYSVGSVLRGFYGRRFLRIFPVFYIWLCISALLDIPLARHAFWYHATYTSNFGMAFEGRAFASTAHFWSLAVEEQFYLIWPFVILATPRRLLIPLALAIAVTGPIFRVATATCGFSKFTSLWLPFANVDALCCGAALAVLRCDDPAGHRYSGLLRTLAWVSGCGLIALVVGHSKGWVSAGADIVLLGLCTTLLFTHIVDRAAIGRTRMAWLLENRVVVYIGRISYCFYVVHLLLPDILSAALPRVGLPPLVLVDPWLRFGVFLGLSLLVSSLSLHLIELPLMSLKRRFPYGPEPAPGRCQKRGSD